MEQEVYEEEGVDWAHIPFVDNQEVLDLIDGRQHKQVSILSLLDEQCVFPKVLVPLPAAPLLETQTPDAPFMVDCIRSVALHSAHI
jgi:Myosin head (motor domain)